MKPEVFNYADYEALKAELKYLTHCDTCKNYKDVKLGEVYCDIMCRDFDRWEWRGVRSGKENN